MNSDYTGEYRPTVTAEPSVTVDGCDLEPLGDMVIIRKLNPETISPGGIIIPDSAQEKSQQGEILAVGPGRWDDRGNRCAMNLSVGDKVLFARYSGVEIKVKGQEFLIVKERDVLAKVK